MIVQLYKVNAKLFPKCLYELILPPAEHEKSCETNILVFDVIIL